MDEWMNEWMNEWTNKWTKEPTNERTNKLMNGVMTNHKENARMNQKSDILIIGMEDYVTTNERMKDLIDGFKDKWIAKKYDWI